MKSMNSMLVSLPTQSRLAIHQWPNKAGSDAAKLPFMTGPHRVECGHTSLPRLQIWASV
jgi:hypothetical protein